MKFSTFICLDFVFDLKFCNRLATQQLCGQKIKVSGVVAAGELNREVCDVSGEYLSVKLCQTLSKLCQSFQSLTNFFRPSVRDAHDQ